MSDKEKAMALWFQQVSHRFHRGGYGAQPRRPGAGLQHLRTQRLRERRPDHGRFIGRRWDSKAAPVRLVSHAIAQVPYDGGWHVMDGDLDSFFLLRDNETVASDRELARDHDLIKRAHTLRHHAGRHPPPR